MILYILWYNTIALCSRGTNALCNVFLFEFGFTTLEDEHRIRLIQYNEYGIR